MSIKPPVVTDFGQFTRLRSLARDHNPDAVRQAAQQFEALFTQTLLKSARATQVGDDLLGGSGGDMYRDLFDQQMSMQMASGKGLGLADMLVRQLKMSGGMQNAPAAQAALGPIPRSAHQAVIPASPGDFLRSKAAIPPASAAAISAAADSGVRGNEHVDAGSKVAASEPVSPAQAFATPQDFVDAIRPHAEAAAKELGVSPNVLIAQAALETGWGRHLMRGADGKPSFNFFGIKADNGWQGGRATHMTSEFDNGQMKRQGADFRSYASIGDAFTDYVRFLKSNPRYAQALQHQGDSARFAAGLQKAGYATDPAYAAKLMRLAGGATMQVAMAATPPRTLLA